MGARTAREIIALYAWGTVEDAENAADYALGQLKRAGYRILAPGEWDAETLEAAAKEAQAAADEGLWGLIPDRIRSMKE